MFCVSDDDPDEPLRRAALDLVRDRQRMLVCDLGRMLGTSRFDLDRVLDRLESCELVGQRGGLVWPR
ncbi:hypothetical protein Mal64_35140 [Pseudobythopirellula maris]|uniref:Uncharacterized protein n=1 Tax=Pseudobythopirellula maris TaxID=2527991 RepID=A0A5C5ZHU1_9BACT|nr:hypothetical protein [Pseudobythopirellula maris]TWT86685.1 hypothetical protein Mal64_35140 [Pseudobythopirellula maris]